ncbi:MAG: hypothetical protein HP493_14935 [Nitrospira sp.]|nr:hypothetical protein [Nitrospira sp.]
MEGALQYSHKISSLEEAITQFQGVYIKEFEPWGNLLNTLPVSLRYSLDGSDFLDAKEELYYQTIGSDEWLLAFRTYLTKVVASLDEKLKEHSGIVSMSDIDLDEILRSEHNKYRQN